MNGVKGFFNVINRRGDWENALQPSLEEARIGTLTLEEMMEAINASLSAFHKYLTTKAKRFIKTTLPWWDLFAPVGQNNSTYTWREAQRFIVDNFGTFSNELASLAQRTFDRDWIDAEPRDGKRGGAFHMRVPNVKESHIL